MSEMENCNPLWRFWKELRGQFFQCLCIPYAADYGYSEISVKRVALREELLLESSHQRIQSEVLHNLHSCVDLHLAVFPYQLEKYWFFKAGLFKVQTPSTPPPPPKRVPFSPSTHCQELS